MASEIFEFLWAVPEQGYEWTPSLLPAGERGIAQPFLVEKHAPGSMYKLRHYDPLRHHSALFRTFAATEPSEPGILKFACKYGWLGEPRELDLQGARVWESAPAQIAAEPRSTWTGEIASMREAIRLWDLVRGRSKDELARLIAWELDKEGRQAVFYVKPRIKALPERTIIASPDFHPEWLARFRPGDLLYPARVQLHRIANAHLEGRCTARLSHDPGELRSHLRLAPHNLLGCLWLQLAEALAGNKDQRECVGCREWFQVGGRANSRSDKKFCSAACRNRVYRSRIENAQEMYAQGKKPKAIAAALGVDIESVRSWVRAKGSARKIPRRR